MTPKTAIYARISDDRDGTGLGVERQEIDCRRLAEDKGLTDIEIFTDNDISAFNGKKRPSYLEMMARIKSGEFENLIAWASDRLHRSPRELEDFIDTCEEKKINIYTVKAGNLNLSSPDGRAFARILGTMARAESEKTSDRIQRKALEKAMKGETWGTGNRPFGYMKGGMVIEEREAIALREIAQRFLAGESIYSLCRWLNEEEILTPAGKPFRAKTLRDIINNPRISGERAYKGEIVATATWPAIISKEEGEAIRSVLNSRKRLEAPARTAVLVGLLVCGLCGKKLVSHNKEGRRRYICRKDTVTGRGCGGIYITANLVEDLIVEAVLTRLNSPEMERALAEQKPNPKALAIHAELSALDSRFIELAEMVAQGDFTRLQYQAAMKVAQERKGELERTLAKERGVVALAGGMGSPQLIEQKWKSLNLDRQRAILKSILESVEVDKTIRQGYGFNPARIRPIWKF